MQTPRIILERLLYVVEHAESEDDSDYNRGYIDGLKAAIITLEELPSYLEKSNI